ncbi:MAG: diguanylate cyclase [Acidimicrobiales bacterium]
MTAAYDDAARSDGVTATPDGAAPSLARRWLDRRPPRGASFAVVVALTLLMGVLDQVTGPYLASATFYLIPVALAAWYLGRQAALAISVLATLIGFVTALIDPGEVPLAVAVANQLLRLGVYAFVAVVTSAERRAMSTLEDLAAKDPLTQLSNRRWFYQQAEAELRRAAREAQPLAVVYLDVDGLKARNDTYGHEAGDEMLVAVADVVRRTLRASDLTARVGGDEFCLLLPATGFDEALEVVDRVRRRLEDAEPLPVRVSAGVVAGPVAGDVDVESLVRAADLLMLEAKATGQGRTAGRPSLQST